MATLGHGASFKWNAQTVAELKSIGGISLTSDKHDVTTHLSTIKQYLQGVVDGGDIPISGFFKPSDTNGQIAMLTDMKAKTQRECIITLPGSIATFTFDGFIIAYNFGPMEEEGIPFSATVAVNSDPVLGLTAVVGMSACGFSNDVLMMPTFAIGTYDYVVTITNGEASTVITPVDATSGEVITITANGASQVVATGVASTAIALSASAITEIVITISKTACISKTYTFKCAVLAA